MGFGGGEEIKVQEVEYAMKDKFA
jgi:hypothetical protein